VNPSIALAAGRTGKWTAVEDSKLMDAVRTHGDKDWAAVAALVPRRTRSQCKNRWHNALDPSIDRANKRTGKWAEDEDSKLKDAVQTHGGKNWGAIATLVPGRTRDQCSNRWHSALDPSISLTGGRWGRWTVDEDIKLKDAVQTHGGNNWGAIATLVPGRTRDQCSNRWHSALDPSISLTGGRGGRWTADEDIKLKDAVQMHGSNNWDAIATLVPGRTRDQCSNRWHSALDPSIALTAGRGGKWTADEDTKLKDAVQIHGGKNWNQIAALVPGRTKEQCGNRWHNALDPSIALTAGREGKWTEDEDTKLKDAVQTHGGKDWDAISALVPGRTKMQCRSRWQVLRRSPKQE
jgi:myb proto-oncogene protein